MDVKTVRNLALIGGAIGIGALVLNACGKKETEPAEAATNLFRGWDLDGNGLNRGEAIKQTNGGAISSQRQLLYRDADGAYYRQQVGYQRVTTSAAQALEAADQLGGVGNKDGNAAWDELTALAASFNRDNVPTLNRDERGAFENTYRPQVISRENVWTGTREFYVRDYPTTNPGGGTSPGDDGPGRGTSPGDDGPTRPGGGGTSPGDDGGTRPVPRPEPRPDPAPAPRPEPPRTSPGDSTDNGNPGEDDF